MSSFMSYLPDYESNMDRRDPGRKRGAPPPRVDDFEIARRSQRNPMFFTSTDDDVDSIFGDDEPSVIHVPNSNDHSTDRRPVPSRNGHSHTRYLNNHEVEMNRSSNTPGQIIHPTSTNIRQPAFSTDRSPRSNRTGGETIEIKDEVESDSNTDSEILRSIPVAERVKVFIGRRNRAVHVKRSDLAKSPILQSYIIDDPLQGSFIMRPQLLKTHFDDFEAVTQFLRSGEYAPMLLENPADPEGYKLLDGLKGDEEYAKQLIRNGKLCRLAKTFGVEGLAALVFRKVSEVDPGRFSVQSLVRIAGIVFKEASESVEANASGDGDSANENEDHGGHEKDALEEWIIGRLAHNFGEIMRIERERFWDVARLTRKKMMYARVLDEVAHRYRATGGNLPDPVIELD